MNALQFREWIVRPTCKELGLWSWAAEALLLITWAQESLGGQLVKQGYKTLYDGRGVALGVYQMEPATHDDIWINFLRYHPVWRSKIANPLAFHPPATRLIGDLVYATQMARLHYYRVKEALPPADNLDLLAVYWDEHYNKNPDKGFPSEALANYKRYVS